MFFSSVRALVVSIGLAAAMTLPAAATTVTVTKQTTSIFGVEQWDVLANYKKLAQTGNWRVLAGAFQLHTDDWKGLPNPANFMAFCLTPFTAINLNTYPVYTIGTALSTNVQSLLGALAHGAWGKIKDATTAGAFQLAAWEIVTDGDAGPFNFDAGDFLLRSGTDAAARAQAQTWLTNVANGDDGFAKGTAGLTFLSVAPNTDGSPRTQNLLTYTPPAAVPLPGALGFLIAALAGLTALGRVRRA